MDSAQTVTQSVTVRDSIVYIVVKAFVLHDYNISHAHWQMP